MNLLEDIQNAASDPSSSVSTLLRKCKILAARLGNRRLEDWIVWESDGYPEDVSVPNYRIWQLQVRGNFLGPYSKFDHAPIPTVNLPKDVQKSYNEYKCRFSIASVESIIENENKNVLTTRGLASVLGGNVYPRMTCVECWAEFSIGDCIELINAVRNRILDFSLALWNENPAAGETSSTVGQLPSPDETTQLVNQTFNTTVHGGSANLLGTANRSSIEFNVGLDDFESVRRVLQGNGMSKKDIAELEDALDEDGRPHSPNQFGPKVSSWIAGVMKKASEGTWNIGIGAAGKLLADVISKFYGL